MGKKEELEYLKLAVAQTIDSDKDLSRAIVAGIVGISVTYLGQLIRGDRDGNVKLFMDISRACGTDLHGMLETAKEIEDKEEGKVSYLDKESKEIKEMLDDLNYKLDPETELEVVRLLRTRFRKKREELQQKMKDEAKGFLNVMEGGENHGG